MWLFIRLGYLVDLINQIQNYAQYGDEQRYTQHKSPRILKSAGEVDDINLTKHCKISQPRSPKQIDSRNYLFTCDSFS